MSSNTQHTPQGKRKRGDVAEKVIRNLEPYKKRELSPSSSRLRDNLFEMANKSLESGDTADENMLESVFDFFEVKQEQAREAEKQRKELSNEIVSLEKQLKDAREQLADSQQKEQKAKAEMYEFELVLGYGDWIQGLINKVRNGNQKVEEAEIKALKHENQMSKEKATEHAEWAAFKTQDATKLRERVEAEERKVYAWRAGIRDEDTAPATPFLDRIQKLCDAEGITRPQLLAWIKEYSKRNTLCHTSPPQIQDYQKTTRKAGKDVKVEIRAMDPFRAFDWARYKEAFNLSRNDIGARYAAGKIDERTRDFYLEAINAYWALYSVSEDEDGKPIPTKYAKDKARWVFNHQEGLEPKNPPKRYKTGKWDDIEEEGLAANVT
ncbi:Ff.00g018150.m01.CDS01 [Fusarium sp. VM40]|nr:Ff.00g018150.m01.CDS01 [Fusarium sp. VM40]